MQQQLYEEQSLRMDLENEVAELRVFAEVNFKKLLLNKI